MDEDLPFINITAYKPRAHAVQKRVQQQPNRNRTIIRGSVDESSRNEFSSRNNVWKQCGNPADEQESMYPKKTPSFKKLIDPACIRTPRTPDQKVVTTHFSIDPERAVNLAHWKSHPDRSSDDNGGLSISNVPSQFGSPAPKKCLANEKVPKKVKVKPKLSIPTNPNEVSCNWEGLRRKLGIKETSTFTAPAVKNIEVIEEKAEPQIPAEIPEADADSFVKTKSFSGLTKTVAMDCEFVGVGPAGQENMLARVSIVNLFGHCVYDEFVKPTELVKDYRTHVSGVRPQDLKRKGKDFKIVQKEVADILQGRILVGHAVYNDLAVLLLGHPKSNTRDTSKFKYFRKICGGGIPSLRKLTAKLLGFAVQTKEHNSVQDAQATMRIYTKFKKQWESEIKFKSKKARLQQKPTV